MIKTFCDEHWNSEAHGAEPMKPDAGGRMMVFAPEGETCSFCASPATHTAGPAGTPSHTSEPTPRMHLENPTVWVPRENQERMNAEAKARFEEDPDYAQQPAALGARTPKKSDLPPGPAPFDEEHPAPEPKQSKSQRPPSMQPPPRKSIKP